MDEAISPYEMLDLIVSEAKKLGADGLVNMSINTIKDNVKITESGLPVMHEHYVLKGFAIKRK